MFLRSLTLGLVLLPLAALAGCCHHNQSKSNACCPPAVVSASPCPCPTPGCSNFGAPPAGTVTAVVPGFSQ